MFGGGRQRGGGYMLTSYMNGATLFARVPQRALTRPFTMMLLVFGGLHALAIGYWILDQLLRADGVVIAGSIHPIGGDFINLWTAGHMVRDGAFGGIYTPSEFSAFQQAFVSSYIGHRIWAYPPQSLFLAYPFSLVNYWVALAAWSVLSLTVLAYGARRIGLGWPETFLLLASPASLMCLNYGQSGNLAVGLLLVALTHRSQRDGASVLATTILTIKPQLGFLLPVLWLRTRQWRLIALVAVAILVVLGLSVAIFGVEVWRGYVFETLTELRALQIDGSGTFVLMSPSIFMAKKILFGDGDLALSVHLVFALAVFFVCVRLIWRSSSRTQRHALALVGMALITPYLHFYDMSVLLVASFLAARLWAESARVSAQRLREYTVLLAWFLPYITVFGNALGVPVSPLLMLGIFAVIAFAPVGNR